MAVGIVWNTTKLDAGLIQYLSKANSAAENGLMAIGDELLRLSTQQVPHDKGMLQNSSQTEKTGDLEITVGYNTEYAAYQHEGAWPDGTHVIRNHSKQGRKTKYLIDPLMSNMTVFNAIFRDLTGSELS